MSLFPLDWYWLADDGRVYASSRQTIVDRTDAGFAAFVAIQGGAVHWPRDATGAQTPDALQQVLQPYGLSVSGATRSATGYRLVLALSDTQRTAMAGAKQRDQDRLIARGPDLIPEDNPSVARLATKAGIAVGDWFTAALAS